MKRTSVARCSFSTKRECHASNLLDPRPTLSRRIDLVLFRGRRGDHDDEGQRNDDGGFVAKSAEVVGDEPADRLVPSGLWPSDHAGVVATLRATDRRGRLRPRGRRSSPRRP
jgi:hypothetical protein